MIYQDMLDTTNEEIVTVGDVKSGRKRMRLHQLSWEEKIQRKKLRNRIAAQTSRDRKKARMDHLEESVKILKEKNLELATQILALEKQNQSLVKNNAELQRALSIKLCSCTCMSKSVSDKKTDNKSNEEEMHSNSDSNSVRTDHFLEVPAESSNDPQQKGRKALTQDLMFTISWTLWKIFTHYLLTQKYWENSKTTHSWMTWRNWQQVCFKKLNTLRVEEQLNLQINSPKKLIKENTGVLMKWWGRHQKNWNPVEVTA